jgi:hypothetical protein
VRVETAASKNVWEREKYSTPDPDPRPARAEEALRAAGKGAHRIQPIHRPRSGQCPDPWTRRALR